MPRAARLPDDWCMSSAVAASLPDRLRTRQPVFEGTGGLHAAGIFTADGDCIPSPRDGGRANAVDKVVGRMLLDDKLPLARHALVVSGRVSFELVQKAWIGGIG